MKIKLSKSFLIVVSIVTSTTLWAQEKTVYGKEIPNNLNDNSKFKRASKPFEPFTDAFIKEKQMDKPAVLPNGETITAAEYAAEINRAEEALNKEGLSIRDNNKKPVEVGTLKNNQIKSTDLQNAAGYPNAVFTNKNMVQLNGSLATEMQQVVANGAIQQPSKGQKQTFINPSIANDVLVRAAKDAVSKIVGFDYHFGDRETVFAGAFAKYEVTSHAEPLNGVSYATSTNQEVVNAIKKTNSYFKMYVGTEGKFSVLGKDVKIFEASFTLDAPSNASKKLSKKVLVYRFGKTLFNEEDTYDGDSKVIDKLIADTVSWTLAGITIPIAGPFSVRTTFSIFGSVGVQYGCTLNRLGVTAAVRPYIIDRKSVV